MNELPDRDEQGRFVRRRFWKYVRWAAITIALLAAAAIFLLGSGGCFFLDDPQVQQKIDGAAKAAGAVANTIVPGSGMIITPLISAIGAGVLGLWTLKRERDNRVATAAIEVQAESIDKLLPKIADPVELKLVKDNMLAAQVATGTHARIQRVRRKPVKAA